jgi:hypothetical protein
MWRVRMEAGEGGERGVWHCDRRHGAAGNGPQPVGAGGIIATETEEGGERG